MNAIAAFVLGLLAGWLAEWIIDWLYWRRKQTQLQGDNDRLQKEVLKTENEKAHLAQQLADHKKGQGDLEETAQRLQAENTHLQEQLNALETEKQTWAERTGEVTIEPEPEAALPITPQPLPQQTREADIARDDAVVTHDDLVMTREDAIVTHDDAIVTHDDLEIIKGIGPVIANLLNQKGITTFRQLGAMTPEELRMLVGDRIQRLADEDSIIDQAKKLAEAKGQEKVV